MDIADGGGRPKPEDLDVGCGSGVFLDYLATLRFENLCGVDPFIYNDLLTAQRSPIYKLRLKDVAKEFDVIMFNHSLEHVASPRAELQAAFDKLGPQGKCIVRIPTPSSEAGNDTGPIGRSGTLLATLR